jgi:hypothetical protein
VFFDEEPSSILIRPSQKKNEVLFQSTACRFAGLGPGTYNTWIFFSISTFVINKADVVKVAEST